MKALLLLVPLLLIGCDNSTIVYSREVTGTVSKLTTVEYGKFNTKYPAVEIQIGDTGKSQIVEFSRSCYLDKDIIGAKVPILKTIRSNKKVKYILTDEEEMLLTIEYCN